MNRLTSRKFILACGTLISTTLLCWFDHISDGVYSAVVIATVGAYITSNVFQNIQLGEDKERLIK